MNYWISSVLGPQYSLDFDGPAGFGGVIVDPDRGVVRFAWKGDPDPDVASKLASPPTGVTVKIADATYSQAELNDAMDRLAERRLKLSRKTGWSLSEMSPRQTGRGLDVEVVAASGLTQRRLGETRRRFSKVADVALTLEEGSEVVPLQGPRWYPESPWRAGAALMTPKNAYGNTGVCSSGVAGKGSFGEPVFLMAAHCGSVKESKYYAKKGNNWTSRGKKFGKVLGALPEHDTLLVGTTGGVTAHIYAGPWNAPKSNYRIVGGAGEYAAAVDSFVGEKRVCTSGAMSGGHCKLRITKTNTHYYSDGVRVAPMSIAVADTGIAVATGDSGGPVYGALGPGKLRLSRGIISAAKEKWIVPCPAGSTAIKDPRRVKCGKRVYFAPVLRALSDFKVTLKQR